MQPSRILANRPTFVSQVQVLPIVTDLLCIIAWHWLLQLLGNYKPSRRQHYNNNTQALLCPDCTVYTAL